MPYLQHKTVGSAVRIVEEILSVLIQKRGLEGRHQEWSELGLVLKVWNLCCFSFKNCILIPGNFDPDWKKQFLSCLCSQFLEVQKEKSYRNSVPLGPIHVVDSRIFLVFEFLPFSLLNYLQQLRNALASIVSHGFAKNENHLAYRLNYLATLNFSNLENRTY